MDPRTFYDSLDLAGVNRLIHDQREEDLYLDFKLVSKPDLSHRPDRKTLAKAISGFANSVGGVIVWGVDAREGPDKIDRAQAADKIDGLSLFYTKLNEHTGAAACPIVHGVEHKVIPGSSADKGFAVTLIPESDGGPHMALLGENRYYKRSGDSFRKMEHFDISDMFGRRRKPVLSLTTRYFIQSANGPSGAYSEYNAVVVFCLHNSGRGLAKYPRLDLRLQAPHKISLDWLGGRGRHGLPVLPNSQEGTMTFAANADLVIHPGATLDVTGVNVVVKTMLPIVPDLVFEAVVYAEGMQQLSIPGRVQGKEIVAGVFAAFNASDLAGAGM